MTKKELQLWKEYREHMEGLNAGIANRNSERMKEWRLISPGLFSKMPPPPLLTAGYKATYEGFLNWRVSNDK